MYRAIVVPPDESTRFEFFPRDIRLTDQRTPSYTRTLSVFKPKGSWDYQPRLNLNSVRFGFVSSKPLVTTVGCVVGVAPDRHTLFRPN